MEVIKPSFEIISHPAWADVTKHLEAAARATNPRRMEGLVT